jgi:hypothetical protein
MIDELEIEKIVNQRLGNYVLCGDSGSEDVERRRTP